MTYSAMLPRLAPDDTKALRLAELDRVALARNTFTDDAIGLIVRSSEGLLRSARNLAVTSRLEAVRNRTRTVDLKQVNRVLLQRHWHFVDDSAWDDKAVRKEAAEFALEAMTSQEPIQVWIVDDTGFLKKGEHSLAIRSTRAWWRCRPGQAQDKSPVFQPQTHACRVSVQSCATIVVSAPQRESGHSGADRASGGQAFRRRCL